MAVQLGSLFTMYCVNSEAPSHTFFSLNSFMCGENLSTHMIVPNCESSLRRPNLAEAIPQWLKPLCYRLPSAPRSITEAKFLRGIDGFDAVYLFPDSSQKLLREAKRRGKPVFAERINCHTGKAKQILDDAYDRLGLQPNHSITAAMIERESEDMEMSDFVFCPSPEVKTSFLQAGVPERKLISASYGWSTQRFSSSPPQKQFHEPQASQIVVLFVGTLSVRKGAHLLLQAWEKAGIAGRLMLCGRMEPVIAARCAHILSRPDVVWREHNPNIGEVYASADIFAFPSLEEGGPLVTYEAMAHGMPVVVSQMGAGAVVRPDLDGIVISPYDEDAWIDALRRLATSADLRRHLGNAARLRAQEFTWEKAAVRRANSILERLNHKV